MTNCFKSIDQSNSNICKIEFLIIFLFLNKEDPEHLETRFRLHTYQIMKYQ